MCLDDILKKVQKKDTAGDQTWEVGLWPANKVGRQDWIKRMFKRKANLPLQ